MTPGRDLRPAISGLRDSLIRRISIEGAGLDDVIPLWFGEPDDTTPAFIRAAAKRSLDAGETFYAPNRGIEQLREVLADYMTKLHQRPIDVSRVTVSASGMNAIMLAMQMLVEQGDNVVVVTPVWPNCVETAHVMGAETRPAALALIDGRWQLDLDRLVALMDENTRAVFVNSPGNPTGWVMGREQQHQLLTVCRMRGITIIADEVYNRLCFVQERAPSFLDIAEPEDRVISINSFSKTWSMTGWRLGWLTHPANLGDPLAMLTEYNIASPTTFVQHAGVTAVRDGEAHVDQIVARYQRNRDLVFQRLAALPRVSVARPDGAFYAFFALDGMTDSYAFAKQLLLTARVGIAPGAAFGDAGEGWLRLCFAATTETLSQAMDRLADQLT